MPDDPQVVESILTGAVAPKEVKGAGWKAYFSSETPNEFQAAFDAVPLPQPVKAALFDYRFNGIVPTGIRVAAAPSDRGKPGWLRRPLVDVEPLAPVPGAGETPYGKFRGGMVRGVARGVSSLTTPENVGLLGTMKAAPKLLGAAAGGAAATAAGLYFTAQMALDVITSLPEAKDAWEKGDYARLGDIVGGDVVAAALLGHGARETRRTGRPALEEVPKAPRPGPIRVLEAERTTPRLAREQPPQAAQGPAAAIVATLSAVPTRQRVLGPRSTIPAAGTPPPVMQPRPTPGPKPTARPGVAEPLPMPPPGLPAIPEGPRPATAEAEPILGPVPGGMRRPLATTQTGGETQVLIPGTSERYPAVYEVRELADIFPSHNPFTFQEHPRAYYWYRNPRNYADPANQERIVLDSSPGKFQPQRLITDNPDAVNGPPIIEEAGNVLGGNGRMMKLARVYSGTDPAGAQGYRQMLQEAAQRFGIDPAIVEGMENPVLVRRLTRPLKANQVDKALIDLNRDPQAELTPAERAVADARRTPIEAVEYLQRVIEDAGPEATLNDALSGPKGGQILNELVKQGVFTVQEKPTLADAKTGALTAAAKDRIAQMMLGRFFRDSDQFQRTPAEVKNKLERAIAPLAQVQGKGDWDITPKVQEAVDLLEFARASGMKNLDDVAKQGGLFGQQEWSPEAMAIGKKLGENPLSVGRAFRQYAREATEAAQGEMMFGTPAPSESFAAAFGTAGEALPPVPGAARVQSKPGAMFGSSTTRYRPGAPKVRAKRLPNPR